MNLANLKAYALSALAVLAPLLAALFYREKSKRNEEQRKAAEQVLRTERNATEALTRGLSREETELAAARRRRYERLRDGDKPEAPNPPLDS